MSDLIERARLTEEDIQAFFDNGKPERDTDDDWSFHLGIANAATTKAMWAVVEWLDEQRRIGQAPSQEQLALYRELHGGLEQA